MRQQSQNMSEPKVVVKRNKSRKRAFTDDEQLEHSTLPKRPTLREPPAMKETLSQKPCVSPFHAKATVPNITPLNGLAELPLPIMQRRAFPRSGFEGASSSMQDLPEELKKAPKFACKYHLGKCVNKVRQSLCTCRASLDTYDVTRSGRASNSPKAHNLAPGQPNTFPPSRNYMSLPPFTSATQHHRSISLTDFNSAKLLPSTAGWARPYLETPS